MDTDEPAADRHRDLRSDLLRRRGDRSVAETRIRDAEGRMRQVRITARSAALARSILKERLLTRPGFDSAGVLRPDSGFTELVAAWLADLELRDLAEGTKQNYRDQLRLHVQPAFEHYTLAEITTGRVESFLKSQAAISTSRARQSRTLLNLLFGFALRHDAVERNPVAGTSPLRRPKYQPLALTLDQIAAIRTAASNWRTQSGLPGPKPDGQVRDLIEVLLGTGMRPGEVPALRPCDVEDGPRGLVLSVSGTVVQHKGKGAIRQERPKAEASARWRFQCLSSPPTSFAAARRGCRRSGPSSPTAAEVR